MMVVVGSYFPTLKRYTGRKKGTIDVFDYDIVVVPINHAGYHWFYAVIYMLEKRIKIYNSSKIGSNKYHNYLLTYLQNEHKEMK